jgi:hypothetical protein
MSYAILRTAKLSKISNISSSASHNFRERKTDNADPTLTPKNQTSGAQNTHEVIQAVKARLATVPTVRKNAVLAVEYFIGASPEFFKTQSQEAREAYFDNAEKWLIERHGKENLIAFTRQYDETSPHACAYVVPIDARGKLNASHFLDGREKLTQMQTEFAETCGKKFGLKRGIEGSKATHTTIKKFYADLKKPSLEKKLNHQKLEMPATKFLESKDAYARRVVDVYVKETQPAYDELTRSARLNATHKKTATDAQKTAEIAQERAKNAETENAELRKALSATKKDLWTLVLQPENKDVQQRVKLEIFEKQKTIRKALEATKTAAELQVIKKKSGQKM